MNGHQQELEQLFRESQYVNNKRGRELARRFGVRQKEITIWFRNRRRKFRKYEVAPIQISMPLVSSLENVFVESKHIKVVKRKELARDLGLLQGIVADWFQHRRRSFELGNALSAGNVLYPCRHFVITSY